MIVSKFTTGTIGAEEREQGPNESQNLGENVVFWNRDNAKCRKINVRPQCVTLFEFR